LTGKLFACDNLFGFKSQTIVLPLQEPLEIEPFQENQQNFRAGLTFFSDSRRGHQNAGLGWC